MILLTASPTLFDLSFDSTLSPPTVFEDFIPTQKGARWVHFAGGFLLCGGTDGPDIVADCYHISTERADNPWVFPTMLEPRNYPGMVMAMGKPWALGGRAGTGLFSED